MIPPNTNNNYYDQLKGGLTNETMMRHMWLLICDQRHQIDDMCCHFIKLKSIKLCNLEAILSAFIPSIISGHRHIFLLNDIKTIPTL